MNLAPRVATSEAFVLAEGPMWDAAAGLVRWVDIDGGLAVAGRLGADGTIEVVERTAFDGPVGTIAVGAHGTWVAAVGDDLVVTSADGIRRSLPVLGSAGARRFNDGKPDAAGRLLVGTLSLSGPSTSEQLLAVERDGTWRVIDDDLRLSNGLAWSPDGTVLYSVDTWRRVVFARLYDAVSGRTGERSTAVSLDEGFPDGICVDAEGHLWVAVWGLGQVRRYSPAGELVGVIEVPAAQTSSVAFVGELLDTLVITTATTDLDEAQRAAQPLAGRLFTVEPGVRGLPQPLWGGIDPRGGIDRPGEESAR